MNTNMKFIHWILYIGSIDFVVKIGFMWAKRFGYESGFEILTYLGSIFLIVALLQPDSFFEKVKILTNAPKYQLNKTMTIVTIIVFLSLLTTLYGIVDEYIN